MEKRLCCEHWDDVIRNAHLWCHRSRSMGTSRLLSKMAAKLKINGCLDIENLMEFCAVSKQQILLDDCTDDSSTKQPSLTFTSGVTVEGLRTIAVYIASIWQNVYEYVSLLGESALERAEIDQWLEYRQTEVEQALHDRSVTKSILQDFNCHLANKIYLVGNKLSLADVLLYYALHSIVKEMMPQDKEMYTNISRWFYQFRITFKLM